MATGTATLDFGTFPGASDASVPVTGQGSIGAGSLVEAWLRPVASADHTADEHMVETLGVHAGNIAPGTGFTIYGINTSQLNEPSEPAPPTHQYRSVGATVTYTTLPEPGRARGTRGGMGTRLWGTWTVAWAWA